MIQNTSITPNFTSDLRWEPKKKRLSLSIILLCVISSLGIGLTSSSPLAFVFPMLVIGLIGVTVTWYYPDWVMLFVVSSFMYASNIRLNDPLNFFCCAVLFAQIILFGKKPVRHPINYLIIFYISYAVLGLAIGDDLGENIDYIVTFTGLLVYYLCTSNFFLKRKFILYYPLFLMLFYVPIGLSYTYLFATGQLTAFMAVGEILEGYSKQQDIAPILLYMAEWTGERNFLTMNIQLVVGMSLYSFWGAEKKWVKQFSLFSFVLALGTIVFSGSRGALLGMLIVLMIVFVLERKRKEVWVAAVVMVCLGAILIPQVFAARFKEKGEVSPQEDYSKYARKELLKGGMKMARDHIFFGVGVRNFSWAFREYYWKPIYIPQAFKGLEAHNMYIELLAEGGIFIFIIFMTIVGLSLLNFHLAEKMWKDRAPPLSLLMRGSKVGLIGCLACAFFISATVERNFWIVFGYSVAAVTLASREQQAEEVEETSEEI